MGFCVPIAKRVLAKGLPMRQRVEDLGRILERINVLLGHSVFDIMDTIRTKDYADSMMEKPDGQKWEAFNSVAYGLKSLEESLVEIYEIASGQDMLNSSDEK